MWEKNSKNSIGPNIAGNLSKRHGTWRELLAPYLEEDENEKKDDRKTN